MTTEAVNERFAPIRARRAELAADAGSRPRRCSATAARRARAIAEETLSEVRGAMGMRY